MTSLAQTALDFCRECLGWEDAYASELMGILRESEGRLPSPIRQQFHFTDLNAVKDAVQKWCDENDSAVDIGYYGYIPGEWEIQATTSASTERVQSSDLSYALLAACVRAARKLKEPA